MRTTVEAENKPSRCTVCGGAEFVPADLNYAQQAARQNVPEALPYEQCVKCGLWLQFPPPSFQYEADDDKDNRKEGILAEAAHFRWLADRLYETYRPGSVLDIGCSYPLFLKGMKDHGVKDVLGFDGCDMALEYGEELDIPLIQGDFLDHDFEDRKFDLICMTHVIEHFHKPFFAALAMKRLLAPKGVIFIRTPLNDTTGLTRWHLTEYHFQVHPIVFGQRSLKRLFESVGLEMIYEAVGDGVGHGDYDFRKR
jgi:2-polyprenyl-3-methyl-5-hydroxy-6-metoxy-1,4-benzoquinol methylase